MSLRDRLRGRALPTASYPLRVDDTSGAQRALDDATDVYRMAVVAKSSGDAPQASVNKARKALDEAQAALDACFEQVTCRALAPGDFEALVAEHPAGTDEDAMWGAGFSRALFLACVQGDMSADEWAAVLDESCSMGERNALYGVAMQVNSRPPDESIPKGSTGMVN